MQPTPYNYGSFAGVKTQILKLHSGFFVLVLLLSGSKIFAQQPDTANIFRLPVQLDSFVVRSGFDINAFIRRVRADTTFYKAFKSMRFVPYTAKNNIEVFGKHNNVIASLKSRTKQNIANRCRSTTITEEQTTGDFYRHNGDYRYYTSELFAFLFLTKEPVCNETDIVAGTMDVATKGQMEKSEFQLKQLIFNPGSKVVGIPFMAARESIFDEGESEKYDFKVKQEVYEGMDCFVFSILPKPGYERKTMYNELTTWFRKSDFSIVARNYSLSYATLVYDFDVRMRVRTIETGGKLYPTYISYDGNWHIFTKKRERVKFTIEVTY